MYFSFSSDGIAAIAVHWKMKKAEKKKMECPSCMAYKRERRGIQNLYRIKLFDPPDCITHCVTSLILLTFCHSWWKWKLLCSKTNSQKEREAFRLLKTTCSAHWSDSYRKWRCWAVDKFQKNIVDESRPSVIRGSDSSHRWYKFPHYKALKTGSLSARHVVDSFPV